MLINLRDICAIAEQKNMAIAAFNAPSLEAIRAAIVVSEETRLPVIVAHAEGHEPIAPLDTIGPVMVALAERSSAQICINLDHCEHLSYAQRALELGFTGVMFDGSALSYEKNVRQSQMFAAMCAEYGAGLECELGSMGSREGGTTDEGGTAEEAGAIYTNPELAADFVAASGLDALACSFGTVHGIYRGKPKLNFNVLHEILNRVDVPLVMHGGSGVSDEDYHMAIDAGIRKINYYTYGAKYAGEAAREVVEHRVSEKPGAIVYWHDMAPAAYESFVNTFEHVVKVFANDAGCVD